MLFCFQFSTGSLFWLHLTLLLKLAGNQKFSYMTSYLWHSSMAWSFIETNPPSIINQKLKYLCKSVITREGCMALLFKFFISFLPLWEDKMFWTVAMTQIPAYNQAEGMKLWVLCSGDRCRPWPLCCSRGWNSPDVPVRCLHFGPCLPIYGRFVIMRIARVSSYAKKIINLCWQITHMAV